MNLARAASAAAAETWSKANPVLQVGGYASTALRIPQKRGGPTPDTQPFAVHCLDQEGQAELRAGTREKHLAWLRASGRCCAAGPLLPADAPAEPGEAVGSLLLVTGEDQA